MSDRKSEQPPSGSGSFDLFLVWKEYEGIAVHFNDLILKLRFQALAGVAALSALVGIVLRETMAPEQRWPALSVAFGLLCLFWIALAILDICYYNRLLLGAVDAILHLEQASKNRTTYDHLELSSEIRRTVEGKSTTNWWPTLRGPLWFYGLVLAGLLALLVLSLWQAGGTAGPNG